MTTDEPIKPFDTMDIHTAYSYFSRSQDEKILTILQHAFHDIPNDSTPYLMFIRILAESKRPQVALKQLMHNVIHALHANNPELWRKVSHHGCEFSPEWSDGSEAQEARLHDV